jgi:AcrR family transcriptional regulator
MSITTLHPQLAGLNRFTNAQREQTLLRLRDAAARLFARSGYFAVSVDEIANAAGVTRKTFYRHFAGKSEIAADLFNLEMERFYAVWTAICSEDYTDRAVVLRWIDRLIDHHMAGTLFRTFTELGFADPEMGDQWRVLVPNLIAALAPSIPAFAIHGNTAQDASRHGEAALVIFEIINQCSFCATGRPLMERTLLANLLAKRFHDYVGKAASP